MGARIFRPIERRVVDVSGLAANGIATVFLAKQIPVLPYTTVTAYLRCHAGTLANPTPTSANFIINADGFTDEDPGLNEGNNPAFQTALVTTSLNTAFAIGQMKVISVPTPSSLLSMSLVVQCGAVGTLRWVISCDLICKEF